MRCDEIRERFGVYWDLPKDDLQRKEVDQHVLTCEDCAEEFQIWSESTLLIRSAVDESSEHLSSFSMGHEGGSISSKVMKRIYEDESWRLPIPERMYAFSRRMRTNFLVVISFCILLFLGSFLFAMVYDIAGVRAASEENSIYSIQAPQALDVEGGYKAISKKAMNTAVANVSSSFVEPVRFQVGPIESYPDYLLVLSLLGFISMILILNWFMRIKT
ncbi:anti-sigma factor family protein [Paenibacillus sp. KN14-4R]|uniref:anti-sigma factor family protein n=1 Tax=Paenibacillus sp. KN14-4R TaxID=3445773 RepID=UPI003FA18603